MENNYFKKILISELNKRKLFNVNYSMRAFSNFLNIDPSLLSKVLRGKRNLGSATKKVCLDKLNLSEEDFITSEQQYVSLTSEESNLLSNPINFSVLEILKIQKYRSNLALLAKKFNLSKFKLNKILDLLKNTNFITIKDRKINILKKNNSWYSTTSTSYLKKEYQKCILHESLRALDRVDFHERSHSSLTICASREQTFEINKEITKFRRKIDKIISHKNINDRQDVYQLSIGYYPITNKED